MPKPAVRVPAKLPMWLRAWSDKFEEFTIDESLESLFGWRQVLPLRGDPVSILIVTEEQLRNCEPLELLAAADPSKFHQSYVVLDCEYGTVRDCSLLKRLMSPSSGLLVIFTSGYPAAVKYSMGLLEKAYRLGARDLR